MMGYGADLGIIPMVRAECGTCCVWACCPPPSLIPLHFRIILWLFCASVGRGEGVIGKVGLMCLLCSTAPVRM